jgi:hypothetical protein
MYGAEGHTCGSQSTDAYDLTLSGVADDLVREELECIGHYETSDERTYRVSSADLSRLRLAIVERCGEDRAHPDGPLWSERRVYAHTAALSGAGSGSDAAG